MNPPDSGGLTIHRHEPKYVVLKFIKLAQTNGSQVSHLSLSNAPFAKHSQHLYLPEIDGPIFEDISPLDGLNLRTLLHQAESLL